MLLLLLPTIKFAPEKPSCKNGNLCLIHFYASPAAAKIHWDDIIVFNESVEFLHWISPRNILVDDTFGETAKLGRFIELL